jgi:hypothetical protein
MLRFSCPERPEEGESQQQNGLFLAINCQSV